MHSRPTTRLRWFKAFSSLADNLYVLAGRQAETWRDRQAGYEFIGAWGAVEKFGK